MRTLFSLLLIAMLPNLARSQVLSVEPMQIYAANYENFLWSPTKVDRDIVPEFTPSLRIHTPFGDHFSWFTQIGVSSVNESFVMAESGYFEENEIVEYSRLESVTYVGAEYWSGRPDEKTVVFRQSLSIGLHALLTETHGRILHPAVWGVNGRSTASVSLGPATILSLYANVGMKFLKSWNAFRGGAGLAIEYDLE